MTTRKATVDMELPLLILEQITRHGNVALHFVILADLQLLILEQALRQGKVPGRMITRNAAVGRQLSTGSRLDGLYDLLRHLFGTLKARWSLYVSSLAESWPPAGPCVVHE